MKINCSILIVDDEDDLRDILSYLLKAQGMTVYSAENGKVALEMCQNTFFDLVISDISMPVMNGLILFDSLDELLGVNRPKFMFASGGISVLDEERINTYLKRSEGLLNKPYSKDGLMNKIAELFPDKVSTAA